MYLIFTLLRSIHRVLNVIYRDSHEVKRTTLNINQDHCQIDESLELNGCLPPLFTMRNTNLHEMLINYAQDSCWHSPQLQIRTTKLFRSFAG